MALPYDPVWAENGPRVVPTSGQVEEGFPCGPASRELFNWLFYTVFSQFNSLPTDLPGMPGSAALLNPDIMLVEATRPIAAPSVSMTSTFDTWKLNSLLQNEIDGATLNPTTFYIGLPPGRYNVIFAGAASAAGAHQCRLYDRSHGVELGHGILQDSYVGTGAGISPVTNTSFGIATFTLTETTQVSLDHACLNSSPGASFGDQSNDVAMVDAFIRVEREKGAI